MGLVRNGARSFLNAMAKCCGWSRLPGFRPAIIRILGDSNGLALLNLWDPLCAFVDTLIALDDWYNQIDTRPDDDNDEDISVE